MILRKAPAPLGVTRIGSAEAVCFLRDARAGIGRINMIPGTPFPQQMVTAIHWASDRFQML